MDWWYSTNGNDTWHTGGHMVTITNYVVLSFSRACSSVVIDQQSHLGDSESRQHKLYAGRSTEHEYIFLFKVNV